MSRGQGWGRGAAPIMRGRLLAAAERRARAPAATVRTAAERAATAATAATAGERRASPAAAASTPQLLASEEGRDGLSEGGVGRGQSGEAEALRSPRRSDRTPGEELGAV